MIERWTGSAVVAIGLLVTSRPGVAQDDLGGAPASMSLQVTTNPSSVECRKLETANPASLVFLPLRLTFNDDFDEHPLSQGRWLPHYAGGATWPEARLLAVRRRRLGSIRSG
ncbi:hypothetical protein ABIB66_008777 [Bradyrhizobium sp. F1.13.3]